MKNLTLFSAALMAFLPQLTNAQTMTSADIFVVGDVLQTNNAGYMAPGAAGANQTWNFASVGTSSTSTQTMVAPSGTPYGSSFSTATVSTISPDAPGSYGYYNNNASGIFLLGTYSASSNVLLVYQNSEQILDLPCSYNTTWTDPFSSNFTTQGYPTARAGTITGIADGYGTLIMPFGTVTNVLRVKTVEDFSDVITGLYSVDYLFTNYFYYKPGVHFPLVSVFNQTIIIDGQTTTQQSMNWMANSSIGINEAMQNEIGIELFPNPASTYTTVVFNGTGKAMQMELVDATGRVARSENILGNSPGIQQHTLDLAGMTAGIYHLRISSEDGQQGVKRLIVQ